MIDVGTRRQLLFLGAFSDILKRCAIEPPKAAIEIRKVTKADVVGNDAHRPLHGLGLAEHAVGAGEALAKQKCGKRGAVELKQSLQIALCHAAMLREAADRNFPAADI